MPMLVCTKRPIPGCQQVICAICEARVYAQPENVARIESEGDPAPICWECYTLLVEAGEVNFDNTKTLVAGEEGELPPDHPVTRLLKERSRHD